MVYRRGLALLCCLLIVVSGTTGVLAIQNPSTTVDRTNQASVDSPAVLTVDQNRSNFTTPGVVVTDALSMGHQSIGQSLTEETLRVRLENASSEAERIQILANTTDTLAQSVTQLATKSQQARQQYRQGDLTTREYSNRLAQYHTRAEDLVSTATLIEDRTPANADTDVVSQAVELRARLMIYTDPIRDRIATAVTTGEGPDQIYISAGTNGTASAIIEDGTYIRAANRPIAYNSESGQIPEAEPLLENIRQQYPWVMNQSAGVSFSPIPIESDAPQYAYWLTLTFPSGEVNSYIDTSTHDVYQEVQRLQLAELSTAPDITVEKNDHVLTISRSFVGGPLQINVTTSEGRPVQARLDMNNSSIGTTGPDGIKWIIAPDGEYTITATTDETEIQVGS